MHDSNSVLRQHRAVLEFDQQKLAALLRDTNHGNLAFTKKDIEQLEEFVSILMPFAEATDLCQGEKTITISCVVPVVLLLNRVLGEMAEKVKHFHKLVSTLQTGKFFVLWCNDFCIFMSYFLFVNNLIFQ